MNGQRHLKAVPKPDRERRPANAPLYDSLAEGACVELCYVAENLRAVIPYLDADHFFSEEPRMVYAAQCALLRRGALPDPAAVRRELGPDKTRQCTRWFEQADLESNEALGNVDAFASVVHEFARRREIEKALTEALVEVRAVPVRVRGEGDLEDALDPLLGNLRNALARRRDETTALGDGQVVTDPAGAPSGFSLIDAPDRDGKRIFRGWLPGYHITGARSGKGKTVWGLNAAINVAALYGPSIFVTFEQPAWQLRSRSERILEAAVKAGDFSWETAEIARSRLRFIDLSQGVTTPRRVLDMLLRARDYIAKAGRKANQEQRLELVVVDYLQHHRWLGERKLDGIELAANAMTELEKEDIACEILSQLTREADVEEGRPKRSQIYGGSVIVNNALSVKFIHTPKGSKPDDDNWLEFDFLLDKQRHGPGSLTFRMEWDLSNYRMVG